MTLQQRLLQQFRDRFLSFSRSTLMCCSTMSLKGHRCDSLNSIPAHVHACMEFRRSREAGLIGQKTCYKTAIVIEISMAIAVLSFVKEDKGWTKNVFRMLVNS